MSETYDKCFVCRDKIKEGDDLVATEDVTCAHSKGDEPREFEPWEYNPYRGVYCTACWERLMVHARKIGKEDFFGG